MFHPIVSVHDIISFPVIVEFHVIAMFPPIVAFVPTCNSAPDFRSACVCTSHVAITFHPTVASPLVVIVCAVMSSSVASPACNAPLIVALAAVTDVVDSTAFHETVQLAVTFVHSTSHVAFKSHHASISSVAVIPFCTVRSHVIVTSPRYHASAEKSPLISVPFDSVNVYSPSNGSESGFVSDIDSSLTSLYCGTNNPWLHTNLTSMYASFMSCTINCPTESLSVDRSIF